MDAIRRIQRWYASQCDGDWEHTYGVKIDTLDNPGWVVAIDVVGTSLEGRTFESVKRGDSETSEQWLHCRVDAGKFHGACGAHQLGEVLEAFLAWAEVS